MRRDECKLMIASKKFVQEGIKCEDDVYDSKPTAEFN